MRVKSTLKVKRPRFRTDKRAVEWMLNRPRRQAETPETPEETAEVELVDEDGALLVDEDGAQLIDES